MVYVLPCHVLTFVILQITAIILMPSFPGWLAPMHFNPVRFEEFLSFAITVCGTWVGASLLVGGYKSTATSGTYTLLNAVQSHLSAVSVCSLPCWASWRGCMYDQGVSL